MIIIFLNVKYSFNEYANQKRPSPTPNLEQWYCCSCICIVDPDWLFHYMM